MSKYIAIVAEKGAGKSHFVETAKKLLPDKQIASIRFSDPVREVLKILGKEVSRENMQTLITALRNAFHDDGILNEALRKRLVGTNADIIFLDGLRKPEEVKLIRELDGKLIYIKADPKLRFERRKTNVENPDEKDISWEEFLRQDAAAPEASIREVGKTMADIKIENNDTIEEFDEKIKKVLNEISST